MSPPGARTAPTRTATASRTLRRRSCRELLARSTSAAAASRWPIVPRRSWDGGSPDPECRSQRSHRGQFWDARKWAIARALARAGTIPLGVAVAHDRRGLDSCGGTRSSTAAAIRLCFGRAFRRYVSVLCFGVVSARSSSCTFGHFHTGTDRCGRDRCGDAEVSGSHRRDRDRRSPGRSQARSRAFPRCCSCEHDGFSTR